MKQTKDFNVSKYDINRKIIIYGASSFGELAFYMLREKGLRPNYFCDRSGEGKYLGVELIRPNELKRYKDDYILIASADYFWEIKENLELAGMSNICDLECLFRSTKIDSEQLSKRARDILMNKENYINVIHQYQSSSAICFTRIQYVVSERCSLRCRDCTHLMQYYRCPENIDLERYKPGFDRLLSLAESISEIRILGGEPFMNPEMNKIIDWYVNSSKIGSIRVYTNGTIVPNKSILDSLENSKVQVRISDYDINKENIKKLVSVLANHGIANYVTPYSDWQDAGNLECRNRTTEGKKAVFAECFERNCITFYRNELHRCPRSAHAMRLKAMPRVDEDYVDLMDESLSDEQLKKRIKELQKRDFIEACNYCSGPNRNTQHIPAAIQIKEPRTYLEHLK